MYFVLTGQFIPKATESQPAHKRRGLILVVDDSPTDEWLTINAISRAAIDAHVLVARDGEEAIETLGHIQPDLVLLDLHMPKIGGLEVLRWIRNRSAWSTTRVVIVTTSDEQSDKDTARQIGTDGYILKDLDFEAFAANIRSACQLVRTDPVLTQFN